MFLRICLLVLSLFQSSLSGPIYRSSQASNLPRKSLTSSPVGDSGEFKYFITSNQNWTWLDKHVADVELVRPQWIDGLASEHNGTVVYKPDYNEELEDGGLLVKNWVKGKRIVSRMTDLGVEQQANDIEDLESVTAMAVDDKEVIIDEFEEVWTTAEEIVEEWTEDGWTTEVIKGKEPKVVHWSKREISTLNYDNSTSNTTEGLIPGDGTTVITSSPEVDKTVGEKESSSTMANEGVTRMMTWPSEEVDTKGDKDEEGDLGVNHPTTVGGKERGGEDSEETEEEIVEKEETQSFSGVDQPVTKTMTWTTDQVITVSDKEGASTMGVKSTSGGTGNETEEGEFVKEEETSTHSAIDQSQTKSMTWPPEERLTEAQELDENNESSGRDKTPGIGKEEEGMATLSTSEVEQTSTDHFDAKMTSASTVLSPSMIPEEIMTPRTSTTLSVSQSVADEESPRSPTESVPEEISVSSSEQFVTTGTVTTSPHSSPLPSVVDGQFNTPSTQDNDLPSSGSVTAGLTTESWHVYQNKLMTWNMDEQSGQHSLSFEGEVTEHSSDGSVPQSPSLTSTNVGLTSESEHEEVPRNKMMTWPTVPGLIVESEEVSESTETSPMGERRVGVSEEEMAEITPVELEQDTTAERTTIHPNTVGIESGPSLTDVLISTTEYPSSTTTGHDNAEMAHEMERGENEMTEGTSHVPSSERVSGDNHTAEDSRPSSMDPSDSTTEYHTYTTPYTLPELPPPVPPPETRRLEEIPVPNSVTDLPEIVETTTADSGSSESIHSLLSSFSGWWSLLVALLMHLFI